MRGWFRALALVVGIVVWTSGTARAGLIVELGDAGQTRASAHLTSAADGDVSTILGRLSDTNDADVYALQVLGGTFTAQTFKDNGTFVFDPVLQLFNASGARVAREDDIDTTADNLQAYLNLSGLAAGTYYLALTAYDNDTVHADNFDLGWNDNGKGADGNYRIELTGATPAAVPEPASLVSLTVGGLTLLGLALARRGGCPRLTVTAGGVCRDRSTSGAACQGSPRSE